MNTTPTPFNFDEGRAYPMHPCCHTVEEMRKHERPENRESSCTECMEIFRRDGVPILPAFRKRDGMWAVWCRLCGDWHVHCPEFGHREAHCHDVNRRTGYYVTGRDNYRRTGYALAYAGEWKDREVKA